MQRGRSGLVVLTKRGATPYLVVASLLNRFELDQRNHGGALQRPSGIIPYLVQCGVKLPGSVEQQMSSATPSGLAGAQRAEQRSSCREALNNKCPLLCQVAGQTPKALNSVLLQRGVKVPEGVEQQMSSGMPIGIPDAQIVEPSTTDVSQLFADQAEDYKKAIGARSESCWRPLSGTKEGRRSAQTSPLSR